MPQTTDKPVPTLDEIEAWMKDEGFEDEWTVRKTGDRQQDVLLSVVVAAALNHYFGDEEE